MRACKAWAIAEFGGEGSISVLCKDGAMGPSSWLPERERMAHAVAASLERDWKTTIESALRQVSGDASALGERRKRLGEVTAVSEGDQSVGIAWLHGMCFLVVAAERNESEGAAFIEGAARDCRDVLFALYGPKSSEWVSQFHKVKGVVSNLLFGMLEAFLGLQTNQPDWINARAVFQIGVAVSRWYPSQIFDQPNLGQVESVEEMMAREALEDSMDLLEQQEEVANDTLDESDLCLPIGIAMIINGSPIHSSFSQEDLFDIFRILVGLGLHRHDGNVDGSSLYIKCIPWFSSVKKDDGSRVALQKTLDPSLVVFERRILAVVALGQAIVVRAFVSQHPDVHGSGHLDPYGILPMERAIQEMESTGLLRVLGRSVIPKAQDLIAPLRTFKHEALNELARENSQLSRPRAKSLESGSLWSRLKRVGSDFALRRNRASSVDLSEPLVAVNSIELDSFGSFDTNRFILLATSQCITSALARKLITDLFGGSIQERDIVLDPLITEQSNLPLEALSFNPFTVSAFLQEHAGCSLEELEDEYGI